MKRFSILILLLLASAANAQSRRQVDNWQDLQTKQWFEDGMLVDVSFNGLDLTYKAVAASTKAANSTATGPGTVVDAVGTGSERWELQYEGPVRPEWWGALVDDGLNDLAALQSSIDSIPATGGTVALSPGEYTLDGPTGTFPNRRFLVVPNRVVIRGEGRDSTSIKLADNAGEFRGIFQATTNSTAIESFELRDVTIDFNGSTQTTPPKNTDTHDIRMAFDGNSCQDFTCRGCRFVDGDGTWVLLSQFGRCDISKNVFENCGDKIEIDHSSIYVSSGYGIISENEFVADPARPGTGSAIETHGPYSVIDNIVTNYSTGVNLTNIGNTTTPNDHLLCCRNVIVGVKNGIALWGDATNVDHVTVSENHVTIDRDAVSMHFRHSNVIDVCSVAP